MIRHEDIPGFFACLHTLDPEKFILLDYEFETNLEPRLAVAQLCCEQSTAQWKRAGYDEDFRHRFGAKAIHFDVVGESTTPLYHLPWVHGSVFKRIQARIAHPIVNFGPRFANLLSAVAGEGAFYCPGMTTLRLMDIHFPDTFLAQFDGPQFGMVGMRDLLQVADRPLFIGVVKPNLGLAPSDFAQLAYESWMGGLDIAKDDEMLADAPLSPLKERLLAVTPYLKKAITESQTSKIMIANITDDPGEMPRLYHIAHDAGANTIMINTFFTGFGSIKMIRQKSTLPLMGHFTGMALYDRMPYFGLDGVVSVKLQRLAGCDLIGLPGFGARMHITDEQVLKNIQACLAPMGPIKSSLPIPGGSDWAGTLPTVYHKVGHADFGFISGRGVYGHPEGPRAGAISLHQAWQSVKKGISLKEQAQTSHELAVALDFF